MAVRLQTHQPHALKPTQQEAVEDTPPTPKGRDALRRRGLGAGEQPAADAGAPLVQLAIARHQRRVLAADAHLRTVIKDA